jgi:hypothetical protein
MQHEAHFNEAGAGAQETLIGKTVNPGIRRFEAFLAPLLLGCTQFARQQLVLLTREWYTHPNGQLPAYEWALSDVSSASVTLEPHVPEKVPEFNTRLAHPARVTSGHRDARGHSSLSRRSFGAGQTQPIQGQGRSNGPFRARLAMGKPCKSQTTVGQLRALGLEPHFRRLALGSPFRTRRPLRSAGTPTFRAPAAHVPGQIVPA